MARHRPPVFDLHTHPLLNMCYLGKSVVTATASPGTWNPFRNRVGLDTLRDGGVRHVIFSIYTYPIWWPAKSRERVTQWQIAVFRRFLESHPDTIRHVTDPVQLEDTRDTRLSILLAIEGGRAIGDSLDLLESLRREGLTYMTLAHFRDNRIASSANEFRLRRKRREGLTRFGREVVREMGRLGLLVDLAHCSDAAFHDVASLHAGPLLVSHTGMRKFFPTERGLSDEQLQIVARSGGLVGIINFPWYLNRMLRGHLDHLVDHIAHVADHVGIEYVGLGSDFDGWTWTVQGLSTPRDWPRLAKRMRERGFSRTDIRKVFSENALSLLRRTWGKPA